MKTHINFYILYCIFIFLKTESCTDNQFPPENHTVKALPDRKPLSLTESIIVGGTVGAAEVGFPGQILSYAMNQTIRRKPFIAHDCYKGFTVNALGQMPITALQKAVQTKGTEIAQKHQGSHLSDAQKAAISYIAGIAGAMIDTPSNAVQLYMQDPTNTQKSAWESMKDLRIKALRGFAPNAFLKEGPFAVGYQALAPKCREIASEYFGDNIAATAIGGASAGVFTAIATQPGAVLRNKMQSDLYKKRYSTTWITLQKIYQTEGFQGLFSGLMQRGTRVAIAVPLYVAYTTFLENKLRGRS